MSRPKALPRILAETDPVPARLDGPQTDRQARFVQLYSTSGINGVEAARLAGYASPETESRRLLTLPHIRQAIRGARETIIQGDLAKLALETLGQLMANESTPAAVRHSAARTSLEMSGHLTGKAPEALESKALGEMTIDELQRFIEAGEGKLAEIMDKAKIVPAKVIPSARTPDDSVTH